MENPKSPDRKAPHPVDDEEDVLVRRDGFAGPEGQTETDQRNETDGGEVSGLPKGDGPGRKPVGGAS